MTTTMKTDIVTLPKALRAGIAEENGRYAIAAVLLQPTKRPGVAYAIGTCGRQLTISTVDGNVTQPVLVPEDALPKTKTAAVVRINRDNNDVMIESRRPDGKVIADVHPLTGSFPPIEDIVPKVADNAIRLTLDAKVLLKAARALTHNPDDKTPKVTLFINRRLKQQNKAIAILGKDGFGVIMGCKHDDRTPSTMNALVALHKEETS